MLATKLHPVLASKWKYVAPELKETFPPGLVPINDALFDLWYEEDSSITLLYGSYGSGKSVFIVDNLLKHAYEDEYFRCYFGRKILETVRGTVYQTIIDRIKDLKLENEFKFSESPNSNMHIVCKRTGHSFQPFGGNNPASLKSIKDPTHFFMEELDQFTFEDFGLIYSRLRTEKAKTKLYGAFNTEKIYQSHWIRKVFFDGEFKDQSLKRKVNYTDNHFINQEEYFKKLQLIANGNAAILNAIANGEWGMVRTGAEFLKSFDETKHVKPVQYVPGLIYVSLDENVNPYITATIWQVRGEEIAQIHEITSESPHNNAPKAAAQFCDWLDKIGHRDLIWVCGDPSASKRSTVDENSSSFYTKYIEVVTKRGYRSVNKVQKSAPEVALSGAFINAILEGNISGTTITIGDKCFRSIEDYLLTKEDAEGKPFPEKKKDPETGIVYESRGHILDTARYLIVLVLAKQFEAYKGRRKSNIARFASSFQ